MPELYFRDHPGPPEATPLVVLHGLFGSGVNWRGVARRLSEDRRVLVMDMRNHGRSFKHAAMTYPEMARDVLDTLDREGIGRPHLLGHSMGGKASMVAALDDPGRVDRLVVVDIAPVDYSHTHAPLVDAMLELDVANLKSRAEADEVLQGSIGDRMIRQFLLQSLEGAGDGYRWRLNLEALKHGMEGLLAFPDRDGRTFERPALFLHGAASDYVHPDDRSRIEHYFPNAQYFAVEDAGHWVHAERPEVLIERVRAFLAEP